MIFLAWPRLQNYRTGLYGGLPQAPRYSRTHSLTHSRVKSCHTSGYHGQVRNCCQSLSGFFLNYPPASGWACTGFESCDYSLCSRSWDIVTKATAIYLLPVSVPQPVLALAISFSCTCSGAILLDSSCPEELIFGPLQRCYPELSWQVDFTRRIHLTRTENCHLVVEGGTRTLTLQDTTPTPWPLDRRLP